MYRIEINCVKIYNYIVVWLMITLLTGCSIMNNNAMPDELTMSDQNMTESMVKTEIMSTVSAPPNIAKKPISSSELLNNQDARQALMFAIDKNAIVNELLNDGSVCANFAMPFTYRSYFTALSQPCEDDFDKDKALGYWARAQQTLQFDRASLVLTCSDDMYSQKIAKIVKSQLMSILPHLSIRIDAHQRDDLKSMPLNGQFDLLIHSFTPSVSHDVDISNLYGEPIFFKGQMMLNRFGIQGNHRLGFGVDYYAHVITPFLHQQKSALNISVSEDIATLDPQKINSSVALTVLGNVGEGLVRLEDYKIRASGATHWFISEDQKVYDFYLVPNAVWSNQVAVTARDYVYGWSRSAADKSNRINQLMRHAHVVKYEAIDDYTLRVELSEPSEDFLMLLSLPYFYPVNQTFAETHGENYGTSLSTTLYNGPYVLFDWQSDEYISLLKSSTYWQSDHVLNEGVNFIIESDAKWQVERFENFDLDRCELTGDYKKAYANHPYATKELTSTLYYFSIGRQKNGN